MSKQNTVLSFHGDPSIKEKYLQRVQTHYKLDEIIKGKYWEGGKGCAVGCTVHSGRHDDYQSELGITWRLALVEDSIFENLPNKDAKEFPVQFLENMPVGVDTDIIFKKFVLWNLVDETEGLIYHIKDDKAIAFLKEVAEVYKRSFTEEIEQDVWIDLSNRAHSAYASAYAYAYASAYASAYAYAYASAYASASAYAYASAYASAYAERTKLFNERIIKMRDKLLELMRTAK